MPKRIATEVGCGSFDQLDMQSLNDYKFFFFIFATALSKISGHVIYPWEKIQGISQRYITPPPPPPLPTFQSLNQKIQIWSRSTTAEQASQNNYTRF